MANKEMPREENAKKKPAGGSVKKPTEEAVNNAVNRPIKKPVQQVENISGKSGQKIVQKSLKTAKNNQKKGVQEQKNPAQKGRFGRIAYAILVVLIIAAVGFFIWGRARNELSASENAVGSILAPIQGVFSGVTNWFSEQVNGAGDINQLQADYDEAQMEIKKLNYRISQLEEEEQENIRLRNLLDAQQRYDELDPIYARVIAKESGRWFDIFAINRGTLHGVKAGMAVINEDGLIGRVPPIV